MSKTDRTFYLIEGKDVKYFLFHLVLVVVSTMGLGISIASNELLSSLWNLIFLVLNFLMVLQYTSIIDLFGRKQKRTIDEFKKELESSRNENS